jgi:hypothetical protein
MPRSPCLLGFSGVHVPARLASCPLISSNLVTLGCKMVAGCSPIVPACSWLRTPPDRRDDVPSPARKNHLRRDAREPRAWAADPIVPIGHSGHPIAMSANPWPRRRATVRPGAALPMHGLRQARRRCPAGFQLGREAGWNDGLSLMR